MRIFRTAIASAALLSSGIPSIALGDAIALRHVVSLYADDQGRAVRAPEGVACGESGLVVLADTGNGRLITYTSKGDAVLGGQEIRIAELTRPVRVHLGANGEILALDLKTHAVVRLDAKGKFIGKLAAKPSEGHDDVVVTAFDVDRKGGIYLLDGPARRILVVDQDGAVTRAIPLPAEGAVFTDVCVDAAGTLFAVDPVRGGLWSAEKAATAFRPLTTKLKEFTSFPSQITSDDRGGLFVVDQNGGVLVQLAKDGSFRARYAALGWTEGLLFYPSQMCVAGDVAVVADRSNNRAQVFAVLR